MRENPPVQGRSPGVEPAPLSGGQGAGAGVGTLAGGAPTVITPEVLERLLAEAKPEEWKYVLRLKLRERTKECGYVYRYGWNVEVLEGDAEFVTIRKVEHYDCTVETDLVVIPRTVPTVVKLLEWDTDPRIGSTETIFVMTEQGWTSVRTKVPGD